MFLVDALCVLSPTIGFHYLDILIMAMVGRHARLDIRNVS